MLYDWTDKNWNSGKASEAYANRQGHEVSTVTGWEWSEDAAGCLAVRFIISLFNHLNGDEAYYIPCFYITWYSWYELYHSYTDIRLPDSGFAVGKPQGFYEFRSMVL